jgi:ribosome biogenesis protein BMS1
MQKEVPIKTMMSEEEKRAYSLIQRLNTIKREKETKKKQTKIEKNKIKGAREVGEKRKFEHAHKEYAKSKFKKDSKKKVKRNPSGKKGEQNED